MTWKVSISYYLSLYISTLFISTFLPLLFSCVQSSAFYQQEGGREHGILTILTSDNEDILAVVACRRWYQSIEVAGPRIFTLGIFGQKSK